VSFFPSVLHCVKRKFGYLQKSGHFRLVNRLYVLLEDGGAGVLLPTCIHFLTAPLSECVSGTLCRCNARLCVCVSVTEATEDRGAGMLLPTLHSYSHRSTLCTHCRQPAQQRYAGFPCLLRPDLQNILRRCYRNAKVTIDLRWTSNLQNILRLAFVN